MSSASGRVIAGHGRLEAAKKIGLRIVPVVRVERLSDAEKLVYVIADNRLGELAGWGRALTAPAAAGAFWTVFARPIEVTLLDPRRNIPIQVFGLGTVEARV